MKWPSVYIFANQGKCIFLFIMLFAWILCLPFEGLVLHQLCELYRLDVDTILLVCMSVHGVALLCGGWLIRTISHLRWATMLSSAAFCLTSGLFFFPPQALWPHAHLVSLALASAVSGATVAGWGHYYREATPHGKRYTVAADLLIWSNVLLVVVNVIATLAGPLMALGACMLMAVGEFLGSTGQADPVVDGRADPAPTSGNGHEDADPAPTGHGNVIPAKAGIQNGYVDLAPTLNTTLLFLCLFIITLTISAGLMYQVVIPRFSEQGWLSNWFLPIPYIAAIVAIRLWPQLKERLYYPGISMIGLGFLALAVLDTSVFSYMVVIVPMLAAYGIYDIFWWGMLGEMLDFRRNPAPILGIGLSANVAGIVLGRIAGDMVQRNPHIEHYTTFIALGIVCLAVTLLPLLQRRLQSLLEIADGRADPAPTADGHDMADPPQPNAPLSRREEQVLNALRNKKTYSQIGEMLFLSENTVKTHVRKIYAKYNVNNRHELLQLMP